MSTVAPHQYQLIKGVVAGLQISRGEEDFVFNQAGKKSIEATAMGAAAMGQLLQSTNLLMASGGTEISVDYFTCLVNGKRLMGCFHSASFKEGEELVFVVTPTSAGYVVAAARSPARRLLWMPPYHERGEIAQHKSKWKWSLILSLIGASAFIAFVYFHNSHPEQYQAWHYFSAFAAMFAMILVVNVLGRAPFKKFGPTTTAILAAFGFMAPAEMDLHKVSSAARERIKQETGVPYVLEPPPWVFHY